MMKLLINLFLFSFLFANQPLEVVSDKAIFDETLFLDGNVLFNHPIGEISADSATFEEIKKDKQFPLKTIKLQNNVNVKLQNQATLECESALINNETKTANFSSIEDEVNFHLFDKGKTALFITSQSAQIIFSEDSVEKKSLKKIDSLTFLNNITLTFEDFSFNGEKVIYSIPKGKDLKQGSLVCPSFCLFTHLSDYIISSKAEIDLDKSIIFLDNPQGVISNSLLNSENKPFFSSKKLFYEKLTNKVILKNDVHISEKGLGILRSDEAIIIRNKNNVIENLISNGRNKLTFIDKKDNTSSYLSCIGTIFLDNEKKTIKATTDKTNTNEQIIFKTSKIIVYADKANLSYFEKDHSINLKNIFLEGNIRILLNNEKKAPSFALADQLIYDPDKKTILLLSEKKVLFLSEEKSIKISAKKVSIKKDEYKNDVIKGHGNVRFTFTNEEESRIKKMFSKYIRSVNEKTKNP